MGNDDDGSICKVDEAIIKYGNFMSPEAYLEWERRQEEKYEYAEGEIIKMQGDSMNHNLILSNVIGNIWAFLKDKSCNILPSDQRVYVNARASYFYPDATITCGEPELYTSEKDTLGNPSVIFEILSPSTRNYDMGRKFFFYMQIESVTEYIMIDSTRREVRIQRKQKDDSWKFETLILPYEKLFIEKIGFEISLEEIYAGVIFKKY